MGYELPAAIGASKANQNKSVICIAGDGSIMMNLQELQTIVTNKLPIKIFLLNNSGYVSISQTHRNFFGGEEVGAGPNSGVDFPNFERLSQAFDIPYLKCSSHKELSNAITKTVTHAGAILCEVFIDESVTFAPKLTSKQQPDGSIVSPPSRT